LDSGKSVILGCAGWKDRFNLEDTLFAGAVIDRIGEHFTIHCDSSRMAVDMYRQQKADLIGFAPQLTHYHRLVNRFGLIKDIEFCLTIDAAPVLSVYRDGKLVAE
jgi:2-phosphosulfolactate phosphatase